MRPPAGVPRVVYGCAVLFAAADDRTRSRNGRRPARRAVAARALRAVRGPRLVPGRVQPGGCALAGGGPRAVPRPRRHARPGHRPRSAALTRARPPDLATLQTWASTGRLHANRGVAAAPAMAGEADAAAPPPAAAPRAARKPAPEVRVGAVRPRRACASTESVPRQSMKRSLSRAQLHAVQELPLREAAKACSVGTTQARKGGRATYRISSALRSNIPFHGPRRVSLTRRAAVQAAVPQARHQALAAPPGAGAVGPDCGVQRHRNLLRRRGGGRASRVGGAPGRPEGAARRAFERCLGVCLRLACPRLSERVR